jgi:Mannosyltransferase (PIG-V)
MVGGKYLRCIPAWFVPDVLLPVVVTRLALILVALLGFRFLPLPVTFQPAWEIGADGLRHQIVAPVTPSSHPLINIWSRWDSTWYVDIAKSGYSYEAGKPSNVAFFPLYPFLIRATQTILSLPASDYWLLLVGMGLSNLFLIVGLSYLIILLRLDFHDRVVSRACLYMLTFPTTLFLSSVYAESLFLCLTVAAFYYARRNRWVLACSLAALGTLCRAQGIIVILPLLIEYLNQRNFRFREIDWKALDLALIPIPLAVFASYLHQRFASWSIMFDAQQHWQRELIWPWHTLGWFFNHAPPLSLQHHDRLDFAFLALLLFAAVGAIRLRASLQTYLWTAAVFFASWGTLSSIPRFDLVVFPLFAVLANTGEHSRIFHIAYLVASSMLAAIFMVMNSQWNWVA